MSTRFRYAWGGTLLIFVVAVAMIVREVRQTKSAAAALELAIQRREQARARTKIAEQRLTRTERERKTGAAGASVAMASPNSTSTTGTTAGAAAGAAGKMKLSARDGNIRPEVAVATDPELRALQLRVFDEEFAGNWGPLLQRLNLPEEKVAALKALLRAHEERRLDVTSVAGEQQLELTDPAIQKMRNADGALLAKETMELLGTDDGKIYQQFRRDRSLQGTINDLAVANFQTNSPLTFAESQQLLTILSANSERLSNGFARPNAVNWDVALAQVERSETLSPATIEAFRRMVADQQVHLQIGLRWNEVGTKLLGTIPGGFWLPNFPALQPKPFTGTATIAKPH